MRIAEFAVGIGADMTEFEEEVKGISKTVQHAASSMVMPELSTTQIDKAFKEIKKSSTDALKSWSDFHNMADMEGSSKRWADYKRSVVEASGAVQSFGKDGGPAVASVSGVTKSITGDFRSAIPAISRVTNGLAFIPGPIGSVTVALRGMMSVLAGPGGIATGIAVIVSLAVSIGVDLANAAKKAREEFKKLSDEWNDLLLTSDRVTNEQKINLQELMIEAMKAEKQALRSSALDAITAKITAFQAHPLFGTIMQALFGKDPDEINKRLQTLDKDLFTAQENLDKLKDKSQGGAESSKALAKELEDGWKKHAAALKESFPLLNQFFETMQRLTALSSGERAAANVEAMAKGMKLALVDVGESNFMDKIIADLDVFGVREQEVLQRLRDDWAQTHELMMVGFDTVGAGVRGMFDQFLGSHRQAKDEWDAIWLGMRNTAVSALGELAVQAVKNFLIDKALQATATAATVASMATIAAAAAPAATLVAIATFGSASAIGASSILAAMATVRGASLLKLGGGGLAFGPSLAMVGDNPNARTDPEVIAPLSRLTDIVGSGTRTIIVKGRLIGEGRHIVGVIEDQLEFEER